MSELKKEILDIDLKNKIEKVIKNNRSTKNNIAYGNFFILKNMKKKTKNFEKELNYLIKAHQNFF